MEEVGAWETVRVGSDGNRLYYSGNSMAVDPAGKILCERAHDDSVMTAYLEQAALHSARAACPFLKDADSFTLRQ